MTPPWIEHRLIAEAAGHAIADAITASIGTHVELGIATSFDPDAALASRPLPLRAIVVRFGRPLRDVLIFITSLREDAVRPIIEVAAEAMLTALDVPRGIDDHSELGTFEIAEAVEYETLERALEQTDALYLEATYGMDLPTGELVMVVGTGLLESAACLLNGIQDPFCEGEPYRFPGADDAAEAAALELGDAIELDESSRYELSNDSIGGAGTPELVMGQDAIDDRIASILGGGDDSTDARGIDAYDAMLAAQEQAEAEAAAAIAAGTADSARVNVAAAELPELAVESTATERWTQLLSGVEVELSAELGRTHLALGDITSLASQSVLTLDQLVHEPVDVFVNGTRYATARLVVVDGEYGIEILEVVDQTELVETLAA